MSDNGLFSLCTGDSDPLVLRKHAVEAALELIYTELDETSSPANVQFHLERLESYAEMIEAALQPGS